MATSALDNLGPWLWAASKVGLGLVGVCVALLYYNQDKLLYHPNPPNMPRTPDDNPDGYKHPGQYGQSGQYIGRDASRPRIPYDDNMIKTRDGESIHTWLLLQQDSANVPTLIYFHGNACNMGLRLPKAAQLYAKVGINILMVDYRGYGKSTGKPNEKGINEDALAALDYAVNHPKLKNSKIVLFGDSLGGAVCFSLAHRAPEKVHFIVVENTFKSISAMADILFPFLGPLKDALLTIGWDSIGLIPSITQPILFISGDKDSLVPPAHMRALHLAAKAAKRAVFYSIQNGDHNDSFEVAGASAFCLQIRKFLFGDSSSSTSTLSTENDRPAFSTAEILPNVY